MNNNNKTNENRVRPVAALAREGRAVIIHTNHEFNRQTT